MLGIGSAADLTVATLASLGYAVVKDDIRPLQRRLLSRAPAGFSDTSAAPVWIIHANPPEAEMALFARSPQDWADLYRIGYWTWESAVAPAAWLDTARWFHEIWVPSMFVRDAFAAAFAASPRPEEAAKLRVMPHVVAPSVSPHRSKQSITALTLLDPRSDPERKNPDGAVRAWLKAFPLPGDAQLIVKILPCGDNTLYNRLRRLSVDRPDIVYWIEALSRDAMDALIADCDILISLHRAEGFGLPLAEAMAVGVAVLATGWSGNMTFMTDGNSVPVPYTLVPANRRHNGPMAQWADPDVDAAAAALRKLVLDRVWRARLTKQALLDIVALGEPWRAHLARPTTAGSK